MHVLVPCEQNLLNDKVKLNSFAKTTKKPTEQEEKKLSTTSQKLPVTSVENPDI